MASAEKISGITELLRINKPVLVVAAFVSILSSLIFLATLYKPDLTQTLYLSANTPWGIVTSIFLHKDLSHLSANLLSLWIWTMCIVFPDSLLSSEEIRGRLRIFVPTVFGAAVVANIIWVIISSPGSTSQGASGLVFSVLGTAVGFLLASIMNIVSRFKALDIKKRRKISALISNIIFLAIFLVPIVFYTDLFLVVARGVNIFVHRTAFLIGFFMVFLDEYVPLTQHTVVKRKR